jgi:plasmid replication initiation protein
VVAFFYFTVNFHKYRKEKKIRWVETNCDKDIHAKAQSKETDTSEANSRPTEKSRVLVLPAS